jgi:hypothetical protein
MSLSIYQWFSIDHSLSFPSPHSLMSNMDPWHSTIAIDKSTKEYELMFIKIMS